MKKTIMTLCLIAIMLLTMSTAAMAADTVYADGCVDWTLKEGISGSGGVYYWSGSTSTSVSYAKNTDVSYTDYSITKVTYTYNGGTAQTSTASGSAGSVSLSGAGTYVLTPYYKASSLADETAGEPITVYVDAASADLEVDMKIVGDDGVTYLSKSEFDPDEDEYDLDLDEDVEELYLYVYVDTDDYSVEVEYDNDDIDYDDEDSYYYFEIEVDPDDLDTIQVYVENDDTGDGETYYFNLDGSTSSSGADELEDLELSLGASYATSSSRSVDISPEFDSDVTDYVALIPYTSSYTKATVRFTLEDEEVELEIEGTEIELDDDEYDYTFSLSAGDYVTIDFSVEGEAYTLTVYFAPKSADDEAYLDDLAVRTKASTSSSYELELDPDFDEDETEYELEDASDYSKLYLYADADSDMVILVEGELLTSSYWTFDPDDYDEITVTVYAEDLEEYEEYTIDLGGGSSSLTSLYLAGNSGTVSLSPSFSTSRTTYVANVSNSVSYVYLTLGNGSGAKISFNDGSYTGYSSSSYYALNAGLNTFAIRTGSTHYYVNVYRQAAASSIVSSSQYISVNSGASQQLAAYNINGNNFVKLRDLAYLLNGTAKQFSVTYNSASNLVSLYSGSSYVSVGGEMNIPGSYAKAGETKQSIYLNSSYVYPMAYNIDGNNYVLLRDMAALLDINISFSGSTAYLNTSKTYGGSASSSSGSSSDDFEVDLALKGDDGVTYLSKSEFDPDEDEYDIELDSDVEELSLYVYFDDDDYTVTVKYDGSTIKKSSSNSSYYLYEFDVDVHALDEISVTVKNDDGDKEVYTLNLEEE